MYWARHSLGGGWSGARFAGFIAVVRPEKAIAISEQIIERTKADVEILEVFVTVNGERAVRSFGTAALRSLRQGAVPANAECCRRWN